MTIYNHPEAFCLMKYRTDDGSEEEILWNSRDGVTPFMLRSKNGKMMHHVDWQLDYPTKPDFKPPSGMRVFVDATQELVTPQLKEYVEKIFKETKVRQRYWRTREDAFKALLPDWLHDGEAPWIIITP